MRNEVYQYGCPVEATLDVIGGKWKGVILYKLLEQPRRFSELKRELPTITQRMLTLQLRELEEDGIVHREIYKEIPPRVEYSLTEFGKTLKPILIAMLTWGDQYTNQIITRKSAQTTTTASIAGSSARG
jgi:DNA-binding HxlR family transcriptional regulator